jgi:transcriptional regulator with XRE-family HTH domain
MAALRKANGYTQQQIADKLNVSNKTISKWECDDGYPEISMLPAIAEIYGVTVDELLRGEKSTQTAEKETNNQKAEEQIKYLFNRSASKFNVFYLISLGLGLVALATSIRLIFQMISFNFDMFGGRIIIASAAVSPILFSIVSVILIAIGFNHFVESFKNQDILEKQTYDTKIFRAIKRFGLVIALVFTAIMVIVCAFTLPDLYLGTVLVCFAATIVFSFIIAFLFCKIMRKKYDIQTLCNTNKKQGKINIYKEKRKLRKANISPEIQKLRKKHTKITAIVLSIIVAISIPLSFIIIVNILSVISNSKYTFFDSSLIYP